MYTISHRTQQQRITRKNYVCENNSNPFLRFIICEISTMLGSDRKRVAEERRFTDSPTRGCFRHGDGFKTFSG
jgi:SET domain-containing protein